MSRPKSPLLGRPHIADNYMGLLAGAAAVDRQMPAFMMIMDYLADLESAYEDYQALLKSKSQEVQS